MKSLIIYDNEGFIVDQKFGEGYRIPVGIPYLELDIPTGKQAISVDVSVTPNVPIYENIPETDSQKIADLEAENAQINYALMMGGLI
jgi:hypothetical protein